MSDDAGAKGINALGFGTLSLKQILGIISAFAFALFLMVMGYGATCFGILIIPAFLIMLPRMMGVDNVRLMTVVGVLFAATAILIGGFVIAPGFVEANQSDPSDNDYFADVHYSYTANEISVSGKLLKDPGSHKIYFEYVEVKSVGFEALTLGEKSRMEMTLSGDSLSGSALLDSGKLYIGYLLMTKTSDTGTEVDDTDATTYWTFLKEAHGGGITQLCLLGCFNAVLMILVVFFLILILSNIMRGRMENTRKKMESEGRLYPQGYGKCEKCNAIVLPGEIKCRKCGAYIDRPEEMKPDKKDFFECSECGAEVPGDAERCPRCGAEFDEDELEVTHADGTVETVKEPVVCPECGYTGRPNAAFCTRCGAKFGKD